MQQAARNEREIQSFLNDVLRKTKLKIVNFHWIKI